MGHKVRGIGETLIERIMRALHIGYPYNEKAVRPEPGRHSCRHGQVFVNGRRV